MEQTLFQEKNVWFYQVPVMTQEPRADTWNVDKPLLTGSVRVMQTASDECFINLYEVNPKEGVHDMILFAQSPVQIDKDHGLNVFVQDCADSSRYFVIRVQDSKTGRHAYVGIGYPERSSAFNFKATLQDFARYKLRLIELAEKQKNENLAQESISKDLSLPEGTTIRVNLGAGTTEVKKFNKPISSGESNFAAIKIAPPPPPPTYSAEQIADDEWGEFTSG